MNDNMMIVLKIIETLDVNDLEKVNAWIGLIIKNKKAKTGKAYD